jgi:hypothetical protein
LPRPQFCFLIRSTITMAAVLLPDSFHHCHCSVVECSHNLLIL